MICSCEHSLKKSSTTCHEEDDQLVAWDDVTGVMLDLELVQESRKAEMVYFKKIRCVRKGPEIKVPQGNWQSSHGRAVDLCEQAG